MYINKKKNGGKEKKLIGFVPNEREEKSLIVTILKDASV